MILRFPEWTAIPFIESHEPWLARHLLCTLRVLGHKKCHTSFFEIETSVSYIVNPRTSALPFDSQRFLTRSCLDYSTVKDKNGRDGCTLVLPCWDNVGGLVLAQRQHRRRLGSVRPERFGPHERERYEARMVQDRAYRTDHPSGRLSAPESPEQLLLRPV